MITDRERETREYTQGAQIFVALILAAGAALLSIPGQTGSPYPDIQRLLGSRTAAAFDAIGGSIAEHPAEMIPP
jgi:hypothetical protein